MPQGRRPHLRWNSFEVAKIMARKGIQSREQLAKRIEEAPTTVRRYFTEDWDGEAHGPIVAVICQELNVAFHKIVRDPRIG